MPHLLMTRRRMMSATAGALALSPSLARLLADEQRRFPIGACDWSIGRTGQVSSLELARRIGLDGVQVSFGAPGEGHDLREAETREEYAQASEKYGVEIASLAMGVLNNVPYASSPEAERWVSECIDVMPRMDQKIVLLAFFAKGDIKNKPEAQEEVVRRLKKVAPQAEKAGVVLGLETWLNAEEHMRILDAVGSPAVKVYYDTANMHKMGYDIYKEIRQLGDRICEIHCKENNHTLGNGPIDFQKVRAALEDIDYHDWLVIESATVEGKSLVDCYVHNRKHLQAVFAGA